MTILHRNYGAKNPLIVEPQVSDMDHLFDWIAKINRFERSNEIAQCLLEIGRGYGLSSFSMTIIPEISSESLLDNNLSGWDQEWVTRYVEKGYMHVDPVFKKIFTTDQPFRWSDVIKSQTLSTQAQKVMNEAREFGLAEGYAIPIHSAGREKAIFCYTTEHYEVGRRDEIALETMARFAFYRFRQLRTPADGDIMLRRAERLTLRERECIKWSSEGKTYTDIAEILRISRKAVEGHMSRACQKMMACDKAHLVAECIRYGIIR